MIGRDRERRESRFRRDYSPRIESRNNGNPPSRHLWIGNLSHHIHETALTEQCLRFGELESVAFQPGRSYAFVNYRKEEDAIIAIRALQGFNLAGLPLKIEFAKAERSLAASHDFYHQKRDERRSVDPAAPFERDLRGRSIEPGALFQRDLRARPISPEALNTDKSRTGSKNAEPSEVLWIGFPDYLKVDEMLLRKSFSPFGEIEKITAFPGRTYAFVQFSNVASACRAKEVLQGKLFDNPRVSICFAKREPNSHEHGRNSMNPPFSPHNKVNGHPGRPIEFLHDRKFGNPDGEPYGGSPHFNFDIDNSDFSVTGFGRKPPVWGGASGPFEPMGFHGPRNILGKPEDVFERRNSPIRERGPQHHEFSPGRPPRRSLFYEDNSGMQDPSVFHEAKRLKTGPFPPDQELPEYPFSDSALDKQHTAPPAGFLNLPEHGAFDNNFGPRPFGYNRMPDRRMNLAPPPIERNDKWDSSYERVETGSGSLPINPINRQMSTPELNRSPKKEVWKWEGTIAKSGTAVCRARCLPVGKVMDFMLPEILNCTARTGLDMLAKHFYQAANAWVVFFVPESDADIALYNEFMSYLGEKQRAAVAKLGEKTTLFLVPPSDFSEKVLKVPGKLSISGVILRFQDPSSDFGPPNQPLEAMNSKLTSFPEDVSYTRPPTMDHRPSAWDPSQSYPNSSSEPFPSASRATPRRTGRDDLPTLGNIPGPPSSEPISGSSHLAGRGSEALNESRHHQSFQHQHPQLQSSWSHHSQNPNPGNGNFPPPAPTNTGVRSTKEQHSYTSQVVVQETGSSHFAPGNADTSKFSHQENKPQVSSSAPIPSLQPEQLAHLASLLVQKQQSHPANQSENSIPSSQNPSQNHMSSSPTTFQFGQVHQLLQQNATAPTSSQMGAPQSHVNQPAQVTSSREEEANPHTRLQATLQLAATLLQQIQQQSKASDQR